MPHSDRIVSARTPAGSPPCPRPFDFGRREARWAQQRSESTELAARLLAQVARDGAAILRRDQATRVIAFGSLVEGRAHARSDIDLVVLGTDPAAYWDLRRDLEETLARPVDLHTETDDARFVAKAIARGQVIYAA